MKNRTLQMKRVLRIALLVLLLGAFGTGNVFADGYDYAEVCPSGQTLYYKIIEDDPNSVMVVPPYYYYFYDGPQYDFWGEGYDKPVGDVIIPDRLSNGKIVKRISGTQHVNNPLYEGAFMGCTEVTSVTIPNSVTNIDCGAFTDCTGLVSVNIGDGLTHIGSNSIYETPVFYGCTSLTSIVFGDALTFIEPYAFSRCSSLASVTFPNSLMEIGRDAFKETRWYDEQNEGILYLDAWCMGYKGEEPTGALIIQEGTRGIANDAFSGYKTENGTHFIDITSITFPNSLVFIGNNAFSACNLTSVSFPISLTSIGDDAFGGCENLTSVTIPKQITYIGGDAFTVCSRLVSIYYNAEDAECEDAFSWCSSLATITIGPDVSNIDSNAFKDCNTVHLVVALGATPAVLGPDAFSDLAENSMLMVPCGKKMTYFSQWNMFPYDNILENCDQYTVSMSGVGAGGSITPSTTNAQMGEEVRLTVTPNAGMVLKSIEICNANDPTLTIPYYFVGKANTKIGFIMPQFGVTVHAVFKTSGASVGENNIVVSVYPNPTNGQVTIEAEALKHITISNTLGQIIYEGQADGNMFEYDFSKYGTGLYLIRIETASGTLVKRVFVER